MRTRVRRVMAAAAALGSRLKESGWMSAKTGRAPQFQTAPAVAKKVKGVVTTSSPRPTPRLLPL